MAVQQGHLETAVRLFAWADRTRQMEKDSRPPLEQTAIDRDLATLSDRLDMDTYATAHDIGQRMTMAQAITHALGDQG